MTPQSTPAPDTPQGQDGVSREEVIFPYNPAHPVGTCAHCGAEMVHNVPRIGTAGGFVHKATGQPQCGPRQEVQFTTPPAPAPGSVSQESVEALLGRWQDAIRDHVIKLSNSDPGQIDGAGCDSGDPLDVTLAEIGQAIAVIQDTMAAEAESLHRSIDEIVASNAAANGVNVKLRTALVNAESAIVRLSGEPTPRMREYHAAWPPHECSNQSFVLGWDCLEEIRSLLTDTAALGGFVAVEKAEWDALKAALKESCDWVENRLAVEGHPIPASMSLLAGWRAKL